MTDLTAELIADMVLPLDVVISPDGRWVAYGVTPFSKREEHPTSAVWLVALAGSSPPRQLTAGQANDTSPRWSPDGQSLAFLSDRATRGTAQLYVIAIDGGEARPLTPTKNKRPVLGFKWSPDGQTIAFWSADEPTEDDERREKEKDDPQVFGERWQHARLRLVNVASGEVKTLVSQDRHVVQAAWSPNGVEIAYLTWQTPWLEFAGRGVICECVNVTTGATRLVCQSARLGNPVWSADGHTLLFFAPVSAPSQSSNAVWAVAATGGELRRLALGETSCGGGLKPAVGSQRTVVSIAEGLHTHLAWLDPITGQTDVFWSTAEADSVCDLGWWSVFHQADGSIGVAATRSSGAQPWEVWTSQTAGWPNPAGGVEAMLPLDMPSSGLSASVCRLSVRQMWAWCRHTLVSVR